MTQILKMSLQFADTWIALLLLKGGIMSTIKGAPALVQLRVQCTYHNVTIPPKLLTANFPVS